MRREKLIKKEISFSYLKPSNNKFHMFSICKSLWNIVEQFKEINVNKYKKIIVDIEQLINYALELQSTRSNICFGSNLGEQCSICLEEFTSAEKSTTLACGHNYHDKCLKNMMQHGGRKLCAICKKRIRYVTIDS